MLSRAIAEKFQLSSRSSSAKCFLLLHFQHHHHQQQRQSLLAAALIQKHFSLYCTTSSSSSVFSSKNPQPEKCTTKEQQTPSSLSRSSLGTFEKQTQVPQRDCGIKKGLNQEGESVTDWPRPSEMPWQAKVANSVNLIGRVQIPVLFQASPDGKYWAGTVISQQDDESSDSPPFWIPVVFEGDLAHTAACHLKAKDRVYISGQLSADPPPFTMSQGQANIQVIVRSINYVQGSPPLKKAFSHNLEQCDNHKVVTDPEDNGDPAFQSWRDLLSSPQNWWDNREHKLNGSLKSSYPDFKHKNSGLAIWLNRAPKWVRAKLDGLVFDVKPAKASKGDASWNDLVNNPDKWWDNRTDKKNERSPDFKHKVTGEALWLSDSPAWVSSRLPPLRSEQTATPTTTTSNKQKGS